MQIEEEKTKGAYRSPVRSKWQTKIDRLPMTALMQLVGVPRSRIHGKRKSCVRGYVHGKHDKGCLMEKYVPMYRRSHWDLLDLANEARASYRRRILAAHPDRGGDHATACVLNAAMERLEVLFRRKGLE